MKNGGVEEEVKIVEKSGEKLEKKWKQKFIKIWQYNDMLEQMGGQGKVGDMAEQQMGPRNFTPIMKLGQGSFG